MPNLIKTHGMQSTAPRHQTKRDFSKKEGRSARPWRRVRQQALARDQYTCQKCGQVSQVMEVDHIQPLHLGGTDLLANLQTLCPLCHSIKTSSETSRGGAPICPAWMPQFTKPVFLVYGYPCSGKHKKARAMAGPHDLVISLETIAAEMKKLLHEFSDAERGAIIRERNDRLGKFARGQTHHPRCFIVNPAHKKYVRDFWAHLGAQLVFVEEQGEVCQRRINNLYIPVKVKLELIRITEEADYHG